LSAVLSLSVASGQEQKKEKSPQEQRRIPTTLAEAHAELERTLSPRTLAEIDAVPSEDDMIQYHFGIGLSIRNGWGLWADSPLATYMRGLGFTHPDDMSGVILNTFWRKRHGQDLNLEGLKASAKKEAEAAEKARKEDEKRVQEARIAIAKMMMGLHVTKREAPVVRIPIKDGLNVRFLSPFRGGVFLGVYGQGSDSMKFLFGGETGPLKVRSDFCTLPFYFDLAKRKIHPIRVAGIQEIRTAVVVGDMAWFAGLTGGKAVLVGIGERDRVTPDLPQTDEIPDLGMDGQSLLAVYSRRIFRLAGHQWTLIYSGSELLPRSGLPPQLHENMVVLRDEGIRELWRRLWLLALEKPSRLGALDYDLGAVGEVVLGSKGVSSYCVTKNGDLWVCLGNGTLLRRSQDGHASIAIFHGAVEFRRDLLDSVAGDQGLLVSAVTALSDDTLLLASDAGLYRLRGNELVQELAFPPVEVKEILGGVEYLVRQDLNANAILVLDDRSYVIGCGRWKGVYLLHKDEDDQWKCLPVEVSRDTVVW
jgi:hypothetical protein